MKTAKIRNGRQAGMKITKRMVLIATICALSAVVLLVQGVAADYTKTFSAQTYVPYGNGLVRAWFYCKLQIRDVTKATVISPSYSYTQWTGTSPQNLPNAISMQDSWTWTGIAISISIPPGAGFSIAGNTVYWGPNTVYNPSVKYARHNFSGMSGTGLLVKFTETTTGTHLFGTTWVSAYATNWVSIGW